MAFPSLAGQQRSIARLPLNGSGGGSSDPNASSGMFYTPNPRAPGQYDFSYLYGGLDALSGTPRYKKQSIQPYQFQNPQVSPVAGPQAINESFYSNLANSMAKPQLRPLVAQSGERMRQLQQGFGGSLSDAASKEFQLKNSMKLGEDIAGMQGNIDKTIAEQRIGEQRDISQANFAERQKARDLGLSTGLQVAGQQADENYRSAGFNDSAARYESQDLLARIQAMLNSGAQIPQLQGSLQNITSNAYQKLLDQMGGLTGLGGI